jgi:C-terminal peptidase prc
MHNTILLLASVLFSLTSFASTPEKSISEYWSETPIKFSDFEKNILPHCNDSALFALGCLDALNIMASQATPNGVFLRIEEIPAPTRSFYQQTDLSVGSLHFYTADSDAAFQKNSNLTFKKRLRNAGRGRKEHLENGTLLFLEKADFKTPFQTIVGRIPEDQWKKLEAALTGTAFNAFLHLAVNPHTDVVPRALWEGAMGDTDSSVTGIGISNDRKPEDPYHRITSVYKYGTAATAGLKKNDLILAVDDHDAKEATEEDLVEWITGKAGTTVTLKIRRGNQFMIVPIIRKKMERFNVETDVVNDAGVPIGVLTIHSFFDNNGLWEKVMNGVLKLQEQKVKGIVLDLRDNPGGLIIDAVRTAGLFVGKEKIISVSDLQNGQSTNAISDIPQIYSGPLVVLMNGRSASSAEIVGGALQDLKRAWIVGDRSFGKGTTLNNYPFAPDSTLLPVEACTTPEMMQKARQFDQTFSLMIIKTNSRFHLPTGRTIQLVGIQPDFEVKPYPGSDAEANYAVREEDSYSALPPLAEAWKQPRKHEISALKSCQRKTGTADTHYSESETSGENDDYRLWYAEDLIRCMQK